MGSQTRVVGTGQNRHKNLSVVHVDCIVRGALLSPVMD